MINRDKPNWLISDMTEISNISGDNTTPPQSYYQYWLVHSLIFIFIQIIPHLQNLIEELDEDCIVV